MLLNIGDKAPDFSLSDSLLDRFYPSIKKYFPQLDDSDSKKYELFNQYFINFYHFCFELHPETMIKDALKFKV